MNEKLRTILIDVAVILVIPGALFYLASTFEIGKGVLLGAEQPGAELVGKGQIFLAKLNEMNALKLDMSVFTSPTYRSLVDSTIAPPTDSMGRVHPFIPPRLSAPPTTGTGRSTQNPAPAQGR